jgi:hypothetical protein
MGGRGLRLGQSRAARSRAITVAASTTALLALSGPARAQPTAAPLVPIVTPLRGDDLFANPNGLPTTSAFAPLRLSLTGGIFSQASAFSGCDARSDASGNSLNGFAVQRYTFLRLTPELVLHGFSVAGCAVDSGMGGGLSYSLPLRKNLWLVSSAGFYGMPAPGGGMPAVVTSAARVDVVKQLAWGRTLSVGLGARLGSGVFNALHFGGSF